MKLIKAIRIFPFKEYPFILVSIYSKRKKALVFGFTVAVIPSIVL